MIQQHITQTTLRDIAASAEKREILIARRLGRMWSYYWDTHPKNEQDTVIGASHRLLGQLEAMRTDPSFSGSAPSMDWPEQDTVLTVTFIWNDEQIFDWYDFFRCSERTVYDLSWIS